MDGKFSNSGFWKLEEVQGQNTKTGAPEYGHGLGLDHPESLEKGVINPNMRAVKKMISTIWTWINYHLIKEAKAH